MRRKSSLCSLKPEGTMASGDSWLYHGVALAGPVHVCADEGQVEDGAQDRYSPDKAHHDWEEAPKQEEKAVDLQHDADDGPANQHDEHAAEEEAGGLHLVLLEEEAERPLQADDKGESGHKQDISDGQQRLVKEQDHSEEEEKYAEAC